MVAEVETPQTEKYDHGCIFGAFEIDEPVEGLLPVEATQPTTLVVSHLKQITGEEDIEQTDLGKVDLFIESYYLDPVFREPRNLRQGKANVEPEIFL
jgi:hypothetical protein